MKSILLIALFVFTLSRGFSQVNFPFLDITETILPNASKDNETRELYLDPVLPDVKAIGRGSATIAGWSGYIGMLHNPAYLANEAIAFEFADAQVVLPSTTTDALAYLRNNQQDLQNGRFLDQLSEGINNSVYFYDAERRNLGESQIYDASKFGDELLTNVIGTPDNPTQHGILAFPNIKMQYKNFGLSVYNVSQASLIVTSGTLLNLVRDIHRVQDLQNEDELLIQLATLLYDSYQADGTIDTDVLPVVYSVASSNIGVSFGYGRKLYDKLSVGANFNFYRRALSVGITDADNYDELIQVASNAFEDPVYDFNITIGAEYALRNNLSIGMVASNFLPSRKIERKAEFTSQNSNLTYKMLGDTWRDNVSVNLFSQRSENKYTYSLSIPFVLSTGATWNPINNIYLAAEWTDILANDNLQYNSYAERFRLGAEYAILKNIVSFRLGMTHLKPTIGGGISIPIWNFSVDLDAAYAYTKLTKSAATYIQLKIAYKHRKRF